VQIPDRLALQLPWWTAMAAIVTGRHRGFKPALNRVSVAVVERSARLMSAGRRMGRRFWAKGGPWTYPRGR